MSKRHSCPDGRAALHLLGSLADDEAREFEGHLADCALCRAELEGLEPAVDALAALAPASDLSGDEAAALRSRVVARGQREIAKSEGEGNTQAWRDWSNDSEGDVLILGAVESGWEATALEGIETRRLFVDEQADRVTMLVRMAAGTAYPAHRHAGPEECLVLEGDLQVGDTVMTAGSFQRKATGSRHPVQSTTQGCLLMITSSLNDELLAS